MTGKFPWGAFGPVQRFFCPRRLPRALLDASWGRSCAKPGANSETKGLGIDLGVHFGSKNDDCWMLYRLPSMCGSYHVVGLFSLLLFSFISVFCGRARKRPKGQIRHTLRAKTCFFKVRACAGFAARTTTDGQK